MKSAILKRTIPVLTAVMAFFVCVSALAETPSVEVDGTVINILETPVTAAYAGVIDSITVREGSHVNKGDVIAVLKTGKVYAAGDGTVRLFGKPGDSAADITEHYGAVAYVEPDIRYTLSASTNYAYEKEENRIIHPGENVYLRGVTYQSHTGTGIVTKVNGSSFSLDIPEGNFESGESVYVYRDPEYTSVSRIGRGSASRAGFTAYEGSGVIVKFCAADGSHVNKGDVLFETIEGEFAGYATGLTQIKAPESGVISSVSVGLGNSVNAGDTVCTLYPDAAMRAEVSVGEDSLAALQEGSTVKVFFTYYGYGEVSVGGTVEHLSAIGTADESGESDEAVFKAIIKLDDITSARYGMTVTVTN